MSIQDELREDIKSVLEISSRLDEKVKTIKEDHADVVNRLDNIVKNLSDMAVRVGILEIQSENEGEDHCKGEINYQVEIEKLKIANDHLKKDVEELKSFKNKVIVLENSQGSLINKMQYFSNLIIQGVWIIIVSYLLYKLNLNYPNLP